MTVIAWDGRILAADKMACSVGHGYKVTKIHRLSDGTVAAFSGGGDGAMALLAWLNTERKPSDYPEGQKTNETCAIVVGHDRVCVSYGKTPHPQVIEDEKYAMGHGRDFALAAMHCGKNAREAVELTCELDVYCGCGVDSVEFG